MQTIQVKSVSPALPWGSGVDPKYAATSPNESGRVTPNHPIPNTLASKYNRTGSNGCTMPALGPKNWPHCYPIARHDIETDIPIESRGFVKQSYFLWKICFVSYVLNLVTVIVLFTSGVAPYHAQASGLILASLFCVFGPVLSFYGWHLAVYYATMTHSPSQYRSYLVQFGIQLIISLFLIIGLFAGGGGIIAMISMIRHGRIFAAILSSLCIVILCFFVVVGASVFTKVVRHFKKVKVLSHSGIQMQP